MKQFFILLLTIFLAYLQKTPCFSYSWGEPFFVQYRWICYNEAQALYGYRGLDKKRIPFVEEKKFEYPPLIAYQMYLTALPSENHIQYFKWNALINSLWAILGFLFLYLALGSGVHLYFYAAMPSLLIYLNHNWDISSVAVLAMAYWAYTKKKVWATGLFLGVGFTGKMFPIFAVPFLLIQLFRNKVNWKRNCLQLALGSFLGAILMYLPILVLDLYLNQDYHAVLTVFGFHADRVPDFGTIWHWIPRFFDKDPTSQEVKAVVDKSFLIFMGGWFFALCSTQWKTGRNPWALAGSLTAFCLVVSKIHSPQYALWFLPFFVFLEIKWRWIFTYLFFDLLTLASGFWWFVESPNLAPSFWRGVFIAGVFLRGFALFALAYLWAFRENETVKSS